MRSGILAILLVSAVWLIAAAASAGPVQISHAGIRLNGELRLPEGRTPRDGIVLITHGTMAHNGMEIIVALQDALAERGIASLAITLGLGVDNRKGMFGCETQPHRHKYEDALDEIGAWLDWLKGQGAGAIALMGHSRGGAMTAWFAAERDDPAIRAVVLLAPGTWSRERVVADYRERSGKDLAAVRKHAGGMAPDALLKDVRFLICDTATVSAATFSSYYADEPRFDAPSLLPGISRPTLVIAGSADSVVPGLEEKVAPYLDGDTQFVVVEDAGHFFRDLFMEDVADAVAEFLEGKL
jgi:alpha-beta hydrolase superfamily lysophospholipase